MINSVIEILALPASILWPLTFLFGVIIGSFLNVVIYRFHTGKSLAGSSHCLSCGKDLSPLELIPLVSYLGLRGTCAGCGSYIPPRYVLVETLTGLLFLSVVLTITDPVLILWSFVVVALLVVIVVYDIVHMIIPDRLTVFLGGLTILYVGYQISTAWSVEYLLQSLLAAAAASGLLFSLWWYSGGRWLGFGDVKLIFPLALLVGWESVFSMVVLSFWVGALVGLLLLGVQYLQQRGKPHLRFATQPLTMKSEVPFAPFLIAGFLLSFYLGVDVFDLVHYVTPF